MESFEGMVITYCQESGGWWTKVQRPGRPPVTWWQRGECRPRQEEITAGVAEADADARHAWLADKADLGWNREDSDA